MGATLETSTSPTTRRSPPPRVRDLARLELIEAGQGLTIYGPVGVDKSHIATALGHLACRHGYDVSFFACSHLLADLAGGHADHSFPARLRTPGPAGHVDRRRLGHEKSSAPSKPTTSMSLILRAGGPARAFPGTHLQPLAFGLDPLFPNAVVGESVLDRSSTRATTCCWKARATGPTGARPGAPNRQGPLPSPLPGLARQPLGRPRPPSVAGWRTSRSIALKEESRSWEDSYGVVAPPGGRQRAASHHLGRSSMSGWRARQAQGPLRSCPELSPHALSDHDRRAAGAHHRSTRARLVKEAQLKRPLPDLDNRVQPAENHTRTGEGLIEPAPAELADRQHSVSRWLSARASTRSWTRPSKTPFDLQLAWPAALCLNTKKLVHHRHLSSWTLRRQLRTARTMPSWHPLPQLSIGPRRRSQASPPTRQYDERQSWRRRQRRTSSSNHLGPVSATG